ncbi:MAG: hypothetical protein Q6361_00665, partial [Candidatus Hermodarchaeota archaeon]|nr:hypothetical protein [Candidatus Hermodarchaeota archaeon]
IPAAFKPDVNITWLRRDISDKKSAMGLALLSASKQPNLFVFVTHEFCFLITLDVLYLRPKEERTIRSALFVDPPNQTDLRTLQPLLNDIV